MMDVSLQEGALRTGSNNYNTLETISDDDVSLHSVESGLSKEEVEEEKPQDPAIGKGETMMVNRSKWIVYLVIALSAMVAGILTYYFVKESEKRWYEDEVSLSITRQVKSFHEMRFRLVI